MTKSPSEQGLLSLPQRPNLENLVPRSARLNAGPGV